ncbi:MAG: hypothetical protein GY915_02405, partial [bacterium]|nr:hypothetical protein [bacterium]
MGETDRFLFWIDFDLFWVSRCVIISAEGRLIPWSLSRANIFTKMEEITQVKLTNRVKIYYLPDTPAPPVAPSSVGRGGTSYPAKNPSPVS